MNKPILTACVPCFGRPQRTMRLVNQILEQDISGWEAFIIGDGCPDFQKLMDDGFFAEIMKSEKMNGNSMIVSNFPNNAGGWGYQIRNKIKELANGEYFLFIDNDDCIDSDHFSHYLNEIQNTEYDFVFFNTYVNPLSYTRVSCIEEGKIGHAELIIKTEFLKRIPNQSADYGHDWHLINNMIKLGAKFKKSTSDKATYKVMSVGSCRETEIN